MKRPRTPTSIPPTLISFINPRSPLQRPCSDAQIKVIDFGYATQFKKGDKPMTAFVGTAYATAPEVFLSSYTESCDLWAVGVITYAMLCGLR